MVIRTSQSAESQKLSRNVYTFLDGLRDFKSAFNILILQGISVVSVVILYHAILYNVSTSLMLHIVFCTIGFAFLMTSSILLFAGDNFFGRTMNRYHKSLIHGFFIGMGTVLTITGISIEIDARGTEWPHFSSNHGITGLVAMILMIIASCGGILATHVQRVSRIIPIRPIWWKVFHNSIGLSAYLIGMISICLATQTWWGLVYFTYEIQVAIIVVIGITAFWTSISALATITDYLKSLFDY